MFKYIYHRCFCKHVSFVSYKPKESNAVKLILISLLLLPGVSYGASFDCKLAKRDIEKMICANQSLSQMDEVISTLYFKALKQDGNNNLKKEQRNWLKKRNIACQTLYYCEKSFAQRIDELVDSPHFTRSNLTRDMTLPDEDMLDGFSSEAMSYDLMKDKYRPWPRKALRTFDKHVISPKAVVIGDELFIYYITYDSGEPTLYEYSPSTGETYSVANVRGYRSYYIKENGVIFYTEKGTSINESYITKHYYKPGSQAVPAEVNTFRKHDNKARTEFGAPLDVFALSNSKQAFAFATEVMDNSNYEHGYGVESRYFAKARQAASLKGLSRLNSMIAIYDSKMDDIKVMSDDAIGYGWQINNISWSKDERSIFFDNSGSNACIWEYNVFDKRLQKIIPAHTAESPYQFTYQGNDYILYSDVKRVNNDIQGLLMIAVRPNT